MKITCCRGCQAHLVQQHIVQQPYVTDPLQHAVEGVGHAGQHPSRGVDQGGHQVPSEHSTEWSGGRVQKDLGEMAGHTNLQDSSAAVEIYENTLIFGA